MTRCSKNRDDRKSEAGVSLILVLVALTIFGLLVPILGQFGAVNGVSAYIVKGQRYDRYAAGNGMQSAIAWARDRRAAGRTHVPCPAITTHIDGPSDTSDRDVTVRCRGFLDSGNPEPTDDTPAYAVLALGMNSSGVGINVNNGGHLTTDGAWWSNTTAEIDEVTVDATTDRFGATGNCSFSDGGELFAAPNRCGSGESVGDPLYPSSVSTIGDVPVRSLAYDSVDGDACDAVPPDDLLVLEPGYYWDRAGLDRIGRGSCGPVVIWLPPGRFLFDFDFYNPGVASSRWRIGSETDEDRVVLVGGEPNGWNPGDSVDTVWNAVSSVNAAQTGGACDTSAPGVEMNFASAARLRVESPGRVEICPLVVGTGAPHLAVTGRTSGTTNEPIDRTAFPIAATPAGSGSPPFSWPAVLPDPSPPVPNPLAVSDCVDSVPCDPVAYVEGVLSGRNRDASVAMTIPNLVPAGDRLDGFVLWIRHREPGNDDRTRDSVTIEAMSPMPGVECDETELNLDDDWQDDPVVCELDPDRPPMPTLAELDFDLTLRTGNREDGPSAPLTFQVDEVRLETSSTARSLRAQSGCVANGTCSWLAIDNDGGANEASAFVWGTVYAPRASIRVSVAGQTRFKFARGIVANSFQIDDLPNDVSFAPVSLPGGGIYSDRTVAFEAFLGEGTGEPKLTARVKFFDPVKDPDEPPQIIAWNPHK